MSFWICRRNILQ